MRGGDGAEAKLADLLKAREHGGVARLALESYGAELYGFLCRVMGTDSDAAEVFSQTCEDMWRGLGTFDHRCSVRTWLYVLARHAASRFRRSPWNRGCRTGDAQLDELVAVARSRTDPWRRTDVKDRWRELCDALDEADRALLVLRVDRDLEWNEVGRVMLGLDASDSEVAREAARLRKRYQVLKSDLRARARAAGLVEDEA